ncbi:helix-turn-helix domain-containing protein [Undibacterium fentianense]|uniref:Helix-turn-helix domain-containing protein n=1 Tax=Undibacterium fentianense TaxID=2828728 RepID=A0A941E2Y9_9BURK|nr:helix-turn-helix domain-containing protein [Undibacterium fentianense]MBR7801400.1 helix-turn-helix domain-containing protein [Undibacterium fentianense]
MDIAEVTQTSGLAASTLRYYEEIGLISSTGRRGLRRQFHESVVERLAFIQLARRVGFSLTEIAELLLESTSERKQLRRDLLSLKAQQIDQQIRELTAMRNGLKHAAVCPAPNHFECPSFLRLLRISTKKAKREHGL